MNNFNNIYNGKTVLVTGHTGFKGCWLSQWLGLLGARVYGYSLAPPTTPSCFETCDLALQLAADIRADVQSLDDVRSAICQHRPDFIFHLAAQSLVQTSYRQPHNTFMSNSVGSMNILEALRDSEHNCVVIMVTTDKVYDNQEWEYAYRENDALGGYDPYSASKACAELIISSYRRSFFSRWHQDNAAPVTAVASVRGGNIIGGGDWAENRLLPDCMRAIAANEIITVRNPAATRPWQHVLDLAGGYLTLAAAMQQALEAKQLERLQLLCSAFNFGPANSANKTVAQVVEEVLTHWQGEWQIIAGENDGHEAGKLHLATEKAHQRLGWQPRWDFADTIRQTVNWYRSYYSDNLDSSAISELCRQQIMAYSETENA